jgi:HEAT repeat protein
MSKPKRRLKGGMTAGEAMAILEADPEWVARRDARRAQLEAEIAELRKLQIPLIRDLCSVGYEVKSVWDLVNTSNAYPEALPVLAKHLERDYPPEIKDGIARALAVPDAKFAWPILLKQYIGETQRRTKGGLAAALGAIADDDVLPDLIALLKDRSHGTSRVLLLDGFYRSKDPAALAALVEMQDDPDLIKEVPRMINKITRRNSRRKGSSKLH